MDRPEASVDLLRVARARDLTASGEGRRLRISRRLSGPELAAAVGVSATTLWRWEQGERAPRGSAAVRYADLLRELATGDGELAAS